MDEKCAFVLELRVRCYFYANPQSAATSDPFLLQCNPSTSRGLWDTDADEFADDSKFSQ